MVDNIRVLVADDTDIAREGMGRILALEADIEVAGQSGTVHETIQKTLEIGPDVLLLDLKWFGDDRAGIQAIRRLAVEAPATKIIAITVYPQLIDEAKGAGAVSALGKDVPMRRLVDEIRSVHRLPPAPAQPEPPAAPPAAPDQSLTKREHEVLTLMVEGKTDKEIAIELDISVSTAKNHVASIVRKLGVPNRTGAVGAAYERQLVPGSQR
jgi:DNA-binding NarL/FixJ family response regulator